MEFVINFSGGKDSCAMLAYLCEEYPDVKKHVVFADTGWEHSDAEVWSQKIAAGFGLDLNTVRSSTKTFLSMSEARGKFPGMQTKQCTSDLKRGPIATWIRRNIQETMIVNCMGMRAEESAGRAKMKEWALNTRESNGQRTVYNWLPIHDWNEAKVIGYLAERHIPLHPVYKYLRRFSCRVCIFMTLHDLRQVKINDPEAIEIISRIEDKTKFTMFPAGPIKSLIN
jgi:3'-phosphoadenosine 5'-phosphosulfate sulfotransferase (PAPS reductase)/FAD synthetase